MSGRAAQENIQFKAGSIGPTIGRANTEAKNRIFSCTAQAKECNYDSTQSATPIPVRWKVNWCSKMFGSAIWNVSNQIVAFWSYPSGFS